MEQRSIRDAVVSRILVLEACGDWVGMKRNDNQQLQKLSILIIKICMKDMPQIRALGEINNTREVKSLLNIRNPKYCLQHINIVTDF